MSNYATLKAAIQSAVFTNNNNEITGAGLQAVLLQIVNTVGDGYVFKGVATAGTTPGTPDANVFYIAPAGTYDNFGTSHVVPSGSLGVFTYNGSWSKTNVSIGLPLDVENFPVLRSGNLLSSGGGAALGAVLGYPLRLPQSIVGGTDTVKKFYTYNGELFDLSSNPAAGRWQAVSVNVTGMDGRFVVVNAYTDMTTPPSTAGSWNVFTDADGIVLDRWQQTSITAREVPEGAVWLRISNQKSNADGSVVSNPYPFAIDSDAYENLVNGISEASYGVPQSGWDIFNGAFISGTNGKFAVNTSSQYMYKAVKEGERYAVVGNATNGSHYAFLVSITQNPSYLQDSDNVGYGVVNSNERKLLTIPEGCKFLEVGLVNNTMPIAPQSVTKVEEMNDILEDIFSPADKVYCVPVYGQSLAIGTEATAITTFMRFPDKSVNTQYGTLDMRHTLENSSFGLIDSLIENKFSEDGIPPQSQPFDVMSFASGAGAISIADLKKGTAKYNDLISYISTANASTQSQGKKLVIPAFCWVQGEHDRFGEYTNNYKGDLLQLRLDLDADIKGITGQSEDVHCIVYQTNQLSLTGSTHFNPNSYNSGDGGSLMTVPQAQYELIRDSQYFHASTPIYPMKFVVGANIHIDAVGQKLMGYYEGLSAKRIIDGKGEKIGLYVSSVTKVDSTHIRLNLHAPCPPIKIDTDSVEEVSHYGFSVITSGGSDIASSVSLHSHYSENYIIIETSADCTGAKVRYGVNGTYGESGYQQGSRGNIRDSQGDDKVAMVNGMELKMHNWLYFFEATI